MTVTSQILVRYENLRVNTTIMEPGLLIYHLDLSNQAINAT
jgi:hypothetical protein